MTALSVVVMEPGSDWPGQVGDSTTLVAFSQGGDELLRRTQSRLKALADHHQSVRIAVLACNGETEGITASRRERIARVLLDVVATASGGRLIVSANRAASHPLREHLFALVGALTKALHGSTASVSLRFEAVSPGTAEGYMRAGSRDSGAGSDR
jgi:hypothetical protein